MSDGHEEDRELILTGVPVALAGQIGYQPRAGFGKMQCNQCGNLLWVGPRQQALIHDDPTTRLLCPACAAREFGEAAVTITHLGG